MTDSLLSQAQIDAMRATILLSLPDTGVVLSPGWIADGQGGGTPSWVSAGTYPARLAPKTGMEVLLQDRTQNVSTWEVTFMWGTPVNPKDRIQINGHTLDVNAVTDARSRELERHVSCSEAK